MSMVSPKAIDANGNVTAAIGTGPFKLVSWQKDSNFVMERNEQYFAGAPKLTKLTFKVMPDAESRAMALEAGQIDLMSGREALTAVQR
jgi:peptide/nickel transport system substrate-binding protein